MTEQITCNTVLVLMKIQFYLIWVSRGRSRAGGMGWLAGQQCSGPRNKWASLRNRPKSRGSQKSRNRI